MFRIATMRFLIVLTFLLPGLTETVQANQLYQPAHIYNLFLPGPPTAIVAADINGDNRLDLLVSFGGPGGMQALLGNGDGTFQIANNYVTSAWAFWIAIGDVNGDGKPDALVATTAGVSVFLGNGNGTFQAAQNYEIPSFDGARSIAIGDVNRDGKLDLVVGFECIPGFPDCNHGSGATVLFGDGKGAFTPSGAFFFSGGDSVTLADLDHDGKLDLISDSQQNGGNVVVNFGIGDGTFQNARIFDSGGFDGGTITVADLDGDGNLDIVAANNCVNNDCSKSNVGILLSGGGFRKAQTYGHPGGLIPQQVAVADINADDIPDLVVANFCDDVDCFFGSVGILQGVGAGKFVRSQHYSSGCLTGNFSSVAVGDANRDGTPDIFLICDEGVSVLLSLAQTTTTLVSDENPSTQGQPVTFTATVVSSGLAMPTGRVVFRNGSTSIGSAVLNAGVAQLTKANLPTGTLSITAKYQGDALSQKSISSVLVQVVNPKP